MSKVEELIPKVSSKQLKKQKKKKKIVSSNPNSLNTTFDIPL